MFDLTNEDVRGMRKRLDAAIYDLELYLEWHGRPDAREMALARTKLQEGKMWIGQALGARGNDDYPQELRDHCEERSA